MGKVERSMVIKMNTTELARTANEVRKGILTAIHSAKSGHPGGSLSAAEIFTYLYFQEMKVDPDNLFDPDRDRFILSKGHTAPGQYAAMAYRGYFPVEELITLRKTGSRLQGHPCMRHLPGVDMSTGSLGQGVSAAAGMALAGKMDGKSFRVYTLLGDGELQEGQVWEAAMFAAHRKLDNLVIIVDNNGLQIDGRVEEVCSPYPIDEKFTAFGCHVIHADAHDMNELEKAFREARTVREKPSVIIAHSIKGKGISFMEDRAGWHGSSPDDAQYEAAMKELEKKEEELRGMDQ